MPQPQIFSTPQAQRAAGALGKARCVGAGPGHRDPLPVRALVAPRDAAVPTLFKQELA